MFYILHVLWLRCHFQTKVQVYTELIQNITLITQKMHATAMHDVPAFSDTVEVPHWSNTEGGINI